MQKAMNRIAWKACWQLVLALSVATFALPIVSVRLGWRGGPTNLPRFLSELQLWGFFYPVLAAVAAFIIAAGIWMSDRRGQNVYAMLLPVPRWRFVLMRYQAGLLLLVPIMIALWLGAMAATVGIDLPPGIRTYSPTLALKFALVMVLLFGFTFAFMSASGRAIGIAIRGIGLFLAVDVALLLLSPETNLLWIVVQALATVPGPLAPLGGRWMLIDA